MKSIKLSSLGMPLLLSLVYFGCFEKMAGGTETGNTGVATISGIILDANSLPAKKAQVYILDVNHPLDDDLGGLSSIVDSTLTDNNGKFTSKSLPRGLYNVFSKNAGHVSFQDSIPMADNFSVVLPEDTLKSPASLSGRIEVLSNHFPMDISLSISGTLVHARPDSSGNFTLKDIPEGAYPLSMRSTLKKYTALDTSVTLESGSHITLEQPVRLIPIVNINTVVYDTLNQTAKIIWDKINEDFAMGYNLYRKENSLNWIKLNESVIMDSFFLDEQLIQDNNYEYSLRVISPGGVEGDGGDVVGLSAKPAFSLRDTLTNIPEELMNFDIAPGGNFFTYNVNQRKVQVFDPSGNYLRQDWINFANISFRNKKGIVVDDSSHYILGAPGIIVRYDSLGNFPDTLYRGEEREFISALALYKDTLLYTNFTRLAVGVLSLSGDFLFEFSNGWESGDSLYSLDVDSAGNIYVYGKFQGEGAIQIFDKTGAYLSDFPVPYGYGNLYISRGKIVLTVKDKVYCLTLQGSPVFNFSVTPNEVVAAVFESDTSMFVGLKMGYITRYTRN